MTLATIYNDKEFKVVVTNIANESIASGDVRLAQLSAAGYLWDSANWKRLSETLHGRFLRECGHVNKCPDYTLRALYRERVLEGQE